MGKKEPSHIAMRGDRLLGYVVEVCVPDHREDNADCEKRQTCYKNAMVTRLIHFTYLTFTIISVSLLSQSSSGDEPKDHVSENVRNTNEPSLTADEHQSGKHKEHQSRDGESIRQYLNVYRDAIREEALYPKHDEREQSGNTKTNDIFSQ